MAHFAQHHMHDLFAKDDPHAEHHMNESDSFNRSLTRIEDVSQTLDQGGGHMMHGMMPNSTMAMMYFHGGCQEVILFSTWKTEEVGAFIGSWIAIFLMSFAFEWLKYYRDCMCAEDRQNKSAGKIIPRRKILVRHFVNTFLYGTQTLLGYFLMLIFMIYNVHLCTAILFGALIGFFAIRYRKPDVIRQSVQHCDCME